MILKTLLLFLSLHLSPCAITYYMLSFETGSCFHHQNKAPCCREKSILTPYRNCFFDVLSVVLLLLLLIIIIILIQCPASENPAPLPDKCLCSEPCPLRDGRKKEINTPPCLRLAILGDTCKIKWPLYFVPPPSPICDP